jgi:hypothetical protein
MTTKHRAYELADILEFKMPSIECLEKAATMLRQQQYLLDGADVVIKELQGRLGKKIDEIAELKEQCLAFQNAAIDLAKQLDKKFPEREELPNNCAKTEELTRTGNMNEPVVWMLKTKKGLGAIVWNEEDLEKEKQLFKDWEWDCEVVPLYTAEQTHPAKTLTDEEIIDFINAFCTDMGDYWDLNENNAIPMITAILRKAQEK